MPWTLLPPNIPPSSLPPLPQLAPSRLDKGLPIHACPVAPPPGPHTSARPSIPPPPPLPHPHLSRLDKDLTIGQMQGKFQLVLMPTAGHAIQEDEPERTAEHVAQFLHRFRIGEPPMVIPRAAPRPGVGPVLPIVAGPLHAPGAPATGGSGGGGDGGGS